MPRINTTAPHIKSRKKMQPKPFNFKSCIILSLLLWACSGCVKHPQLLYFRNQSEFVPLQNHDINNAVRIKIQTDDVLYITVKALDPERVRLPFDVNFDLR
jgi:hypothetical protein